MLDKLREANIARIAELDGDIDLGPLFKAVDLGGEAGEALNVVKKLERERLGVRGSRDTVEHLGEELADVIICVDLLALRYGIDMIEATRAKFNATSVKVGLATRL